MYFSGKIQVHIDSNTTKTATMKDIKTFLKNWEKKGIFISVLSYWRYEVILNRCSEYRYKAFFFFFLFSPPLHLFVKKLFFIKNDVFASYMVEKETLTWFRS